mmetsp:Transcript_8913/g.20348  ORF Transcript_8913/g.20348 Transcript_8913/m.20348 type:complete len:750 (+) Transcript_8913:72-2321(+)
MEDDDSTQDSEEDEVQSSEDDDSPSSRPLFTCLVVMPKIQGIQTCSIDVKRSRLCTVTNTHVKDGRYSGGEIQLWSLRSKEELQRTKIPASADGVIRACRSLFACPALGCYLAVAKSGLVWAADFVNLIICGTLQAHDRHLLCEAFCHSRSELVVCGADGLVKVFKISAEKSRDAKTMRPIPKILFNAQKPWSSGLWMEKLTVNEELQVVIGSADNKLILWSLESGKEINRIEIAHAQKITSLCTYKLAYEHRLVSGDLRGNVKLWVLRSDGMRILVEFIATPDTAISELAYDSDIGCIMVFSAALSIISCWDAEQALNVAQFPCDPLNAKQSEAPVPGAEDNVPIMAESETGSEGEKVRQMTAITSLQMFQIEGGRSLLLLQQDSLVRVFSMTMECERFSSTSGALMDLKAMYMSRNFLAHNRSNQDSQTSSLTSKRREHKHATIVCLSSNGIIELFSGKDGSIVNVIEPSVARDILESGGIADDSKQNMGRKKKRPKKKKQAKKDMSATEKRALMAKRIIARVQKERDRREGKTKQKAKKTTQERVLKRKPHFFEIPEGFQVIDRSRYIAAYWSDGSIDILDSEDGKCKCTYGSPLVGLMDPAAMAADDTMKMTCFTFTSKVRLRTESLRHQLSSNEEESSSSDALYLISGYNNGVLRIWDAWTESRSKEQATIKVPESLPIVGLHCIDQLRVLIVLTAAGGSESSPSISFWNLEEMKSGAFFRLRLRSVSVRLLSLCPARTLKRCR